MEIHQEQMFLLSSVKVWRLQTSPECLNIQPPHLMCCHVTALPKAEALYTGLNVMRSWLATPSLYLISETAWGNENC